MLSKVVLLSLCFWAVAWRFGQPQAEWNSSAETERGVAETSSLISLKEQPSLLCKEFEELIVCEGPDEPKLLSSDVHDQHWLVTEKGTGMKEVLQVFIVPGEARYATPVDTFLAAFSPGFAHVLSKAEKECTILEHLHREDLVKKNQIGSKNVIKCLHSNLDAVFPMASRRDGGKLLYRMMEYAGDKNLLDVVDNLMSKDTFDTLDTFDVALVVIDLLKQVLEGLLFLSNNRPAVVIHHDLKPSKIMVETVMGDDGIQRYNVRIIDFGYAAWATKDDVCIHTPADAYYAPKEWLEAVAFCWSGTNYCPDNPDKFDVFSFGMTLVELMTGHPPEEMLQRIMNTWCDVVDDVYCKEGEGAAEYPEDMPSELRYEFTPDACACEKNFCDNFQVWNAHMGRINYPAVDRMLQDVASFMWLLHAATKASPRGVGTTARKEERWQRLNNFRRPFDEKLLKAHAGLTRFMTMKLPGIRSFLESAVLTLRHEPTDRPSAGHLLSLPALSGIPMRFQDYSKVRRKGDLKLPCNEMLGDVIRCSNPEPKQLGHGGFGQAWLVKVHHQKQLDVMKVFFMPHENKLLTMRDYFFPKNSDKKRIARITREARRECEILQKFHESFPPHVVGSKNVMNCKQINFDFDTDETVNLDTPLYAILDDCGSEELDVFVKRIMKENPEGSVEVLRQVFKQVLEGLTLLSKHTPKIIHHDIKPNNIIVKTEIGEDNTAQYSAHIVDFGANVLASKESVCVWTTSTPGYAPYEHNRRAAYCPDGLANFDLQKPEAFDVFSLAVMLVTLITGDAPPLWADEVFLLWCSAVEKQWCTKEPFGDDVPEQMRFKLKHAECKVEKKLCEKRVFTGKAFHHAVLEHLTSKEISSIEPLTRELLVISALRRVTELDTDERLRFMTEMLKDKHAVSFLMFIFQAMKKGAADRPTAEELLDHPWMSGDRSSFIAEISEAYGGLMTDWSWTWALDNTSHTDDDEDTLRRAPVRPK